MYAADTNPKFLEFIKNSAKEKGLDKVETVLTAEDNPALSGKKREFDLHAKCMPSSIE